MEVWKWLCRKEGIAKSPAFAVLAQQVEHHHGKVGVVGSIPTGGIQGNLKIEGWCLEHLPLFESRDFEPVTLESLDSKRFYF